MNADRLAESSLAAAPQQTPWIDGILRPVREGVYRRRTPAGPYSCWDGAAWYADAGTPAGAAAQLVRSPWQRAPWRGLTQAPTVPCFACRGHTVIDRGVDGETGRDLIDECPEC